MPYGFERPDNGISPRGFSAANDYQVDRELQRTTSFSGIPELRQPGPRRAGVDGRPPRPYPRASGHQRPRRHPHAPLLVSAARDLAEGIDPPALEDGDYVRIYGAERILTASRTGATSVRTTTPSSTSPRLSPSAREIATCLMSFDAHHLTPTASLNRMPFIAATEFGMPPDLQGQLAFSLLSARALTALALDQAESLQFSPFERAHPEALNVALRERLESPHERVRGVATSVLKTYGLRLGYLIAILKRGDAESRAAREDTDDS